MAPTAADWAALDKLLSEQSFLGGSEGATQEDFAKRKELGTEPPASCPHALRWWNHTGALAKKFPLRKWPKPVVAKASKESGPKDQANLDRVLVGAQQGKVVTRFPPEPSGYLHIGHAKAALLNSTYAEMYGGKTLLRFDDTNPTKEKMEYQESIVADLKLLEIKHEPQTYSSDYFDELEKMMEKLIKEGKAYVDKTPAEQMKTERMNKVCSKYRDQPVEENLKLWKEVLKGSEEGQNCAVRGKLDMQSDVGCLRDPVFYRCKVDEPHHRHGTKYKAYPTYDFCCAIIDAKEGVTHALRSLEYSDRAAMYQWVLDNCGMKHVELTEFSRMNFDYTVLSKRKLTLLVQKGIVTGWDDPRMPTVRGVIRRGLTVEALKEFVMTQGASRNTNSMSWDKIWAINKQKIDPVIPRYCGIEESSLVELVLSDGPKTLEPKQENLHPKDPEMGTKEMFLSNKVYLRQEDMQVLADGEEVTLMHWGNAIVDKVERSADGKAIKASGHLHLDGSVKSTKYKLNWLPVTDKLLKVTLRELGFLFTKATFEDHEDPMDFLNPTSQTDTAALGEPAMKALKKGDKLQLERGGYYIVDQTEPLLLIEIPSGKAKKVSGETRDQPLMTVKEKPAKGGKEEAKAPEAKGPEAKGEKKAEKGGDKGGDKAKAKAKAGAKAADRPLDDVARIDIRVGKIVKVWAHPEAEKLWCEEIDIGRAEPLKVCSGLRDHYKEEEMKDREVILIANMKPRNMRGVPSQGMVLCATSAAGKVELLAPPSGAKVGERVTMETFEGEPDEVLADKTGKAPLEVIKPDMKTNDKCEATFRGKTWMTSAGPVRCPTNGSSPIG